MIFEWRATRYLVDRPRLTANFVRPFTMHALPEPKQLPLKIRDLRI